MEPNFSDKSVEKGEALCPCCNKLKLDLLVLTNELETTKEIIRVLQEELDTATRVGSDENQMRPEGIFTQNTPTARNRLKPLSTPLKKADIFTQCIPTSRNRFEPLSSLTEKTDYGTERKKDLQPSSGRLQRNVVVHKENKVKYKNHEGFDKHDHRNHHPTYEIPTIVDGLTSMKMSKKNINGIYKSNVQSNKEHK
jgi:hypothetical protein